MSQYGIVGGGGGLCGGGLPEKVTNESLGLVGGGDGGSRGDGRSRGGGEPEKATNESLGLIGGFF